MATKEELREHIEWVQDAPKSRYVGLVFDHLGIVDTGYQITAYGRHTATRLSEDGTDAFAEIARDNGMQLHDPACGEASVGRYLTYSGGEDVDAQVEVVENVLTEAYDIDLADVAKFHRVDWYFE